MQSILQWKKELDQFRQEQVSALQAKFKYIEDIQEKAKLAMAAPKEKSDRCKAKWTPSPRAGSQKLQQHHQRRRRLQQLPLH
eukprot:2228325-Pyramimonas_sp.AAC.1